MSPSNSIILTLLAASFHLTRSHPGVLERQTTTCAADLPPVRYAVFGDAYASGDTYGAGCSAGACNGVIGRDADYGNPGLIRSCRRWDKAWPVQLNNDCSWTKHRSPQFDWEACSGAALSAIPEQADELFSREKAAGSDHIAQFAILQVGSTDAALLEVATTCFFQADPNCKRDYGEPYPSVAGACNNATLDGFGFVFNSQSSGLALNASFDAILNNPAVKASPTFHLFVVGFPTVFYEPPGPTPGLDQCDGISFTAFCADPAAKGNARSRYRRYNVTQAVRVAYNAIIVDLNSEISTAVQFYATDHGPRISYVDVENVMEGHRLCEPSPVKPFTGAAGAWLWPGPRLSDFQPSLKPGYDYYRTLPKIFNTSTPLDPTSVSDCPTYNGFAATAPEYGPWGVQLACELKADGQPVAAKPIGPNDFYSGPGGGGITQRGEIQRTFHPNAEGHKAIARVIAAAIRADFKG